MKNLKNVTTESIKPYLDDFLPTLSNFCSKSPLQITINYVKDLNKIFLKYNDTSLEVDIDPTKNKKEVIRDIKEKLQKDYPVIYEKKIKVPDADEIEKMVDNGTSLEDALNETSYDLVPKYRVLRVHHKYNEVDLLELDTNLIYKFKSKIPTVKLLRMINIDDEAVLNSLSILYRIDNKKQENK